jgi:hypothetical protein
MTITKSRLKINSSSKSTKKILLIAMMFCSVFDFKRASDDQGAFVVIMGLLTVGFSMALLITHKRLHRSSVRLVAPFILFLTSSVCVALMHDRAIYLTLTSALPLFLFITTILVTVEFSDTIEDLNFFMSTVVFFGLCTAVWKFFFSIYYWELDLSHARTQILSGAITSLFSYSVTSIFVASRRLALWALFITVAIVLISVTRTYFLIFCMIIFSLAFILPQKEAKKMILSFSRLLLLLPVALVSTYFFLPVVFDRWYKRLNAGENIGFDPTAYSRLAQASYQIEKLFDNIPGLLFGYGQGAPSSFGGRYAQALIAASGGDGNYPGVGYGHNLYLGCLYLSGILVGSLVVVHIFRLAWQGYCLVKRLYASNAAKSIIFASVWGLLSVCGTLTNAMFSGVFGDRITSLYFGISIGLVWAGKRAFNKSIVI